MVEPLSDNSPDYSSLRGNVSDLGRLLGETIAQAQGADVLQLVERIRTLSKAAREGEPEAREGLLALLRGLDNQQLVPVARAFSQFLNLANIADEHHTVSREMDTVFSASETLASAFSGLREAGVEQSTLQEAIAELKLELVLTAHPTEITRRTLIHKHSEISDCLSQLELSGLVPREREQIHHRLRELIAQIWYGYDFRESRPTPVDEAKWGFAVVEDSLWPAVPEFLRRLDAALQTHCGCRLPIEAAPVSFVSWMGGDRDGNPNVTATVTEEVLLLSRWKAADLYLKDVVVLIDELSMTPCNDELKALSGGAREPYRAVLKSLRGRLKATLRALEDQLAGGERRQDDEVIDHIDQLWQPLLCCYESMLSCNMEVIANRGLLDLLRRVRCFGVHLVRLDVRQDSARHEAVFSALTRQLGLGDYATWDEATRVAFLTTELANPRPLFPRHWQPGPEVQEVLDSAAVVARAQPQALGAYVISMARQASDVLAVELLLKESGCQRPPPVAPLFETLDDLERASQVVSGLLDIDGYARHIDHRLMVMIGYSDSAKDAGVLAASWAQYRAQEALLEVCADRDVKLTLFHGRGGTIGRGGAPAREALLSQPPGSLLNGLRVTEQGEMIRAKLGLTSLAVKTLALYTSAIMQANLLTPPVPEPRWRELMDTLARDSCEAYRNVVRETPGFVEYFRAATPERELAALPLGSRPARRSNGGGISSLRAIPWIFAWSQNRLMLPAWLGVGAALARAEERGEAPLLQEMTERWPFFNTRLSMLEMVFAKADVSWSAYYDERLVPETLQGIGQDLRRQLRCDVACVLALRGGESLMAEQSWIKQSIQLRNVYTDPLNVLQAELLQRQRSEPAPLLEQAIMVTIAGIAAGMRNTG